MAKLVESRFCTIFVKKSIASFCSASELLVLRLSRSPRADTYDLNLMLMHIVEDQEVF